MPSSSLASFTPRDKPPAQSGACLTTGCQLRTGTTHPPHTPWTTEDGQYMQTAHMRPFGLVDVGVMVDMANPIPAAAPGRLREPKTRPGIARDSQPRLRNLYIICLTELGRRCSQNTVIWFVVVGEVVRPGPRVATASPGVWIHGSGAREKRDLRLQVTAPHRKRGWGSSSTCPGTAARSSRGG